MSAIFAVASIMLVSAAAQAQWDPEQRISMTGSDVWAYGIAANGRVVHLVWGISPVYYRRSTDEGLTWSGDSVISPDGEPHLTDPIQANGQDVYVVYLRNIRTVSDWCCPRQIGDIYLRRSTDGGLTWLHETQLTTADAAFRISLAVSGDRLDMVWMDYRRHDVISEIYYRRSLDRGVTWEPEVLLVPAAPVSVGLMRPQVASAGALVDVVWGDDRDANPPCYTVPVCPETYYKRSTDGGATWGPDVRLTNGGDRFAGRPEVARASPSNVVVNYNQDVVTGDGGRIYVMRSSDDGDTWGPEVRLTDSPSDHGAMASLGSTVHLAWHDDRNPGNREIYYAASLDGGGAWQSDERVSVGTGESVAPLLAVSDGYVHAVWGDRRTGPLQVWYRRRVLQSTVSVPPDPEAALKLAVGPSPARERCVLNVESSAGQDVTISIFDVGGRLVKVLLATDRSARTQRLEWDRRNDKGERVPAGLYLVQARAGSEQKAASVVMIE